MTEETKTTLGAADILEVMKLLPHRYPFLLVDRISRLGEAMTVARQTRTIALQSVIVGLALSSAGMVLAALGYLPPLAGALTQEAIDVAVVLNALRALGHADRTGPAA